MRAREQASAGNHRGLSAAWHVVRFDYAVVFAVFVLGAVLALSFLRTNPGGRFVYDDSYITLTFAKNLLRFGRLTFDGVNPGSGATSPLHVTLIALLALITRRVDTAAFLLGVLSLQFAGTFAYYWSREVTQSRRIATVAALLLVTSGWMVFDALSGLETVLFLALLLLALFLFERKNLWYGLPLALSVMTRPDAGFFAAGMAVYALVRLAARRLTAGELRSWLLGAGLFGLALVPFVVFNRVTTGTLLPDTGLAKTYFFGEIGDPLPAKLSHFWVGVKSFYTRLVLHWPVLALVGAALAWKLWQRCYWLLAAIAFYLSYLFLFPGSTMHYWCRYQHIFLPFIMLAIAEGAFRLVRLLTRFLHDARVVRGLGWALGATVAAVLAVGQWHGFAGARGIYAASVKSTEEVGERMAGFLRARSQAGDVIATHDIGALAWFSGRPVLDLVGLANPDVRPLYRDPETGRVVSHWERDVYYYVLEQGPKFLVIFDTWKPFIGFSPDQDTLHFRFLGETKPPFPSTAGGYRMYEVRSDG
jgi:hypothetical protein